VARYTINAAKVSDAGLYLCIASNDAGRVEERMEIIGKLFFIILLWHPTRNIFGGYWVPSVGYNPFVAHNFLALLAHLRL
jgi:hypothetical protein